MQEKIEEIKNLKSFVIESGSSYWNTYSNIALLHDLYEEKRGWEKDVEFQSRLSSAWCQLGNCRQRICFLQTRKKIQRLGWCKYKMGNLKTVVKRMRLFETGADI
ncbi:MAG: hypothetical protein EOP48_28110 [Sphingobacteriales bacterium]|nr:MAG: hypothetical protein EOP48_28110 [Sphingobacteriales bacterium]